MVVAAVCVVLGAVAEVLIAPPGLARPVATLAGISSLVWAFVRFQVLLIFFESTDLAEEPLLRRGSFTVGTVPYLVAVTP